ncbi:septum formation family protein [Nocardioides bruguierae]|uniref:Septum formation family protein n=1 Tax=Nocardioides bruguierae TaxID=2945102 RepID=A0A9X2D973_9ACTN|nr:septum formation family protein [Nocardioides bruguierae]MCL8023951.1 septum formation family protein [Nocardioides bruguierae]MCM0620384.1 septum formation family protein [Nocardioides bruguierae]
MHRLGLSLLALLLGPLVLLAATSAPATAAGAWKGAPQVGDCYKLTWKQVQRASVPVDPVACSKGHQAVVLRTGLLDADTDWDDTDAVAHAIARRCATAADPWTTDDPRVSYRTMYLPLIFWPTAAQRARGARWYRCDLALQGTGEALAQLPEKLVKVTSSNVSRRTRRSVTRCVTSEYLYTLCDRTHAYRGTGTFVAKKLSKRTAKAQRQVRARAVDRCPALTSTDDWIYSSQAVTARSRVVLCYSRLSR